MGAIDRNNARYDKVLLIDDNEIDNFINERIITTSNFAKEIVVKDSALSGLTYLQSVLETNNTSNFPDIIFLDLNMPVMDGYGFLSELDKYLSSDKSKLQGKCKVIVLSSSIAPIDIDRASTNPYVYKYLNKPLNDRYLEALNF